MPQTDLSSAINQFERADLNAARLSELWDAYWGEAPTDIAFGVDSPESDQRRREWTRFVEALPAIDGFKPEAYLPSYHEIAMNQGNCIPSHTPGIMG
jgi:hypothetical protein